MKPVYIVSDNITSPIGNTTEENFRKVKNGLSAIKQIDNTSLSLQPFYAAMFDEAAYAVSGNYTRFEQLCIQSITDALQQSDICPSNDTVFILSTTKGNIELIETEPVSDSTKDRVSLFNTATLIAKHFDFPNKPIVVSNACVSGVLSIIIAKRLLQSGQYKHAIVTGADVLSKFIISGFQSLQAMSIKPCKPFDKLRDGINLGECVSTVVLSSEVSLAASPKIKVLGGAVSNDANHISGPSRTGAELAFAIKQVLAESNLKADDLSFISAHGTATIYNDEMEAKAFSQLGLGQVPVHSLKPAFGHTLGAAGVVESIFSYHSLVNDIVLPSRNFDELGVSENINVSKILTKNHKNFALKTASGFGGCNAAIIYSKN